MRRRLFFLLLSSPRAALSSSRRRAANTRGLCGPHTEFLYVSISTNQGRRAPPLSLALYQYEPRRPRPFRSKFITICSQGPRVCDCEAAQPPTRSDAASPIGTRKTLHCYHTCSAVPVLPFSAPKKNRNPKKKKEKKELSVPFPSDRTPHSVKHESSQTHIHRTR